MLVLQTPPPYGGGERIGLILREHFGDKYELVEYSRRNHSKKFQGKLNLSNILFGILYILRTNYRILMVRPKVLYIDTPKDYLSFCRISGILLPCFMLRVKVIGDVAGGDLQFLGGTSIYKWHAKLLLRRIHRIRVLSESIQRALAEHGLCNTVCFPNGIPEPPLSIKAKQSLPQFVSFLYVGKLAVSKGINAIIDFVDEYRISNPSFKFHLVGEWEHSKTELSILSRIQASGISQWVTFHGMLVGEEKWNVFNTCHIYVHPTTWDGQPVTILEALSCGIPVIATRVGAIPETIDHGVDGYLMKENTVEEILKGVNAILKDEQTYANFSRHARISYEEKFRVETFVERMDKLLTSSI